MTEKTQSIWLPIMELVVIFASIVGVTVPLYIHTDYKMEQYRIEMRETMESNRQETNQMIRSIQEEMKDFHGRLCAIEERNRK